MRCDPRAPPAPRGRWFYFRDGDGDGAIGEGRWRSPPPLAGSYGVDVDSTPLARTHGVSLAARLALKINRKLPRLTTLAANPRAREARVAWELAQRTELVVSPH